jgi:glycosyltransferase involved in cell wall biosynthesis
VARILEKAYRLRGLRVLHVSSTFYGGGVAELLSSATLLARNLGLNADWRLIQGSPDFFNVTKKLHNALQGGEINLTDLKREVYEEVVLQKSLREGFGLTATEAMWKGAAVIAGRCGGLTHQIEEGVNGFLVDSVAEAAERLVQLLRTPERRQTLGARARKTVQERFLLTRMLEQYLDLFSAFEPQFAVNHRRLSALSLPSLATPNPSTRDSKRS